jgi:hypothetical protein
VQDEEVTGCRAHSLAQQPWLITVERIKLCVNPAFYLPLTMQAVSQEERMRRVIIASGVVSLRLPFDTSPAPKLIVSCPTNHDGCRTAVKVHLLPPVSSLGSSNCLAARPENPSY